MTTSFLFAPVVVSCLSTPDYPLICLSGTDVSFLVDPENWTTWLMSLPDRALVCIGCRLSLEFDSVAVQKTVGEQSEIVWDFGMLLHHPVFSFNVIFASRETNDEIQKCKGQAVVWQACKFVVHPQIWVQPHLIASSQRGLGIAFSSRRPRQTFIARDHCCGRR
eukprot:752710-Hanusia_phi.AAC.5